MADETDFSRVGFLLGPGPSYSACPVWLGHTGQSQIKAQPYRDFGLSQWPGLSMDTVPITVC